MFQQWKSFEVRAKIIEIATIDSIFEQFSAPVPTRETSIVFNLRVE